MKRSEIEALFWKVKEEVTEYSTTQQVVMIEDDNSLKVSLLVPQEDVCVGEAYIHIVSHFVTYSPEKPFTMKQLLKVSKIWTELLQSETV